MQTMQPRMKNDTLSNCTQLLTALINVYRQGEINRALLKPLLKAFFVILVHEVQIKGMWTHAEAGEWKIHSNSHAEHNIFQ